LRAPQKDNKSKHPVRGPGRFYAHPDGGKCSCLCRARPLVKTSKGHPIRRSENGSATLLLIGAAGVSVLCLSALGLAVTGAALEHTQNRANELAITAADAASGRIPGIPCSLVRTMAAREAVSVESCEVVGLEARVIVTTKLASLSLRARAHAGPPKSAPNLTSR
jgi:hypothetical protein